MGLWNKAKDRLAWEREAWHLSGEYGKAMNRLKTAKRDLDRSSDPRRRAAAQKELDAAVRRAKAIERLSDR